MIHINVTIEVKSVPDFLALLLDHAKLTRMESGCLQFDFFRCFTDQNRFMLSETFIDRQAVRDHQATPHYKRWKSRVSLNESYHQHLEYETLSKTIPDRGTKINRIDLVQRASACCSQKLVLCPGCFDLFGAHHLHLLSQAWQLGTMLVVALNDDDSVRRLKGKGRPVIPCHERAAILAALDCVDWVVTFSEDNPVELVKMLKPALIVKGEIGEVPEAGDVPVKFVEILAGRSTTGTLKVIRA